MAERPIMRPSELRKAVTEWCAQGFAVKVSPDGSITVTPPPVNLGLDRFDMVDMRR